MPECVDIPAPVMQVTLEAPRKWSTRAASSDSASAGAAGASERSCRTVIVAVQMAAAGARIVAVRLAAGPSIIAVRAQQPTGLGPSYLRLLPRDCLPRDCCGAQTYDSCRGLDSRLMRKKVIRHFDA